MSDKATDRTPDNFNTSGIIIFKKITDPITEVIFKSVLGIVSMKGGNSWMKKHLLKK